MITDNQIYNLDETSIYLDSSENYTYEKKGTKRVCAYSSGNERSRISVALCASALGTKLPLVIVIARKKPLKDFTPPSNTVIVYKPSGTFKNQKRFYTASCLPNLMQKAQKRPILYLDNAPGHVSSETTDQMDDLRIEYSFIPPRFTSLLQPADVCWLKTFKKCYHEKWIQWFMNHATLKHFLENGPFDEYLEANDGENDIEGFENDSEMSNQKNTNEDKSDSETDEEVSLTYETEDEDEVQSVASFVSESEKECIKGEISHNLESEFELDDHSEDDESVLSS
ncbi:unnamed protein product [Brachionus calyciflorus]|uniref:DDE-1 domain-containing protein n=1 Tax=Brachionus calyciflorus TaxID=104777 RepID=A0A813XUY9_9BILA|nr:unnamed protein product [Brachionus calyciflorus]